MSVWDKYEGRKVFLRTNKDRTYYGVVKEIVDAGDGVIFISIVRYDGMWTTVLTSEIVEIKEES